MRDDSRKKVKRCKMEVKKQRNREIMIISPPPLNKTVLCKPHPLPPPTKKWVWLHLYYISKVECITNACYLDYCCNSTKCLSPLIFTVSIVNLFVF